MELARRRGRGVIRNWDGTQCWRPTTIDRPRDADEVARLLADAYDRGRRTKPVGSALSWSDIIDVPERAMRFDRLSRIVRIDRDAKTITVEAGARLCDVNEALADAGLAFDNFGSIVIQTAAGYLGTGTHGTGARTQLLSNRIVRMTIVDGTGTIHEIDAAHEPELFSCARVHLGCLGVVVDVTIQCVDAFDLEERLELRDFDRALADLPTLLRENDYLKLWWLPYTKRIQIYRFNRTTERRTGFSVSEWLDASGLSGAGFSALIHVSRAAPAAIGPVHEAVQKLHFHPHVRIDRSDRIIKVANTIPIHQETEYAIPIAEGPRAIEDVRRIVERGRYRVNFPLEVRFVAADDIPMSPANGRDSCYVGAYVASERWAPAYHADFEDLMHDYEGRPHWGKSFTRTARQLRALYPDYDTFEAQRRRVDPRGVMRNRFVDRVFAPSS